MATLHLTLKGEFYDMIAAGIKREEYREIKPYWEVRLFSRQYTHILFARGAHFHPRIPKMLIELNGIRKGTGRTEWGASKDVEYYVLSLGRISTISPVKP